MKSQILTRNGKIGIGIFVSFLSVAIAIVIGALLTMVLSLTSPEDLGLERIVVDSPAVSQPGFEKGVLPVVTLIDPDEMPQTFRVDTSGYYPSKEILIGTNSLAPKADKPRMYHLNDRGEVLHAWEIQNKFGGILGERRFLENGNIMFIVGLDGVFEMDFTGKIVWSYFDETVNHHAEVIANGNVMIAGVGCDCIKEIDYETKQIIWQWEARHSFPQYGSNETFKGTEDFRGAYSMYANVDISSPVFPDDWTHINYAQYLPESDTFIASLRSFDMVVEINRRGQIIWSFGPGVLKHQHYPRVLPDDTVLIYDNGNGRVIRVTRDHKILWSYDEIWSPFLGWNDLLLDGNYAILQSTAFETTNNESDLRIVNPDGIILWKLGIPGQHVYRVDLR